MPINEVVNEDEHTDRKSKIAQFTNNQPIKSAVARI